MYPCSNPLLASSRQLCASTSPRKIASDRYRRPRELASRRPRVRAKCRGAIPRASASLGNEVSAKRLGRHVEEPRRERSFVCESTTQRVEVQVSRTNEEAGVCRRCEGKGCKERERSLEAPASGGEETN